MTCCAGMEYHASLPAKAGMDRFADPECLIHVTADGQMGIIVHDGSGRYSIIRYCPWCGEPLTEDARPRDVGLVRPPEWPGDDAPIYNESQATGSSEEQGGHPGTTRSGRVSAKGKRQWTKAERAEQSEKVKAFWARRKAAKAATAGGEGGEDA